MEWTEAERGRAKGEDRGRERKGKGRGPRQREEGQREKTEAERGRGKGEDRGRERKGKGRGPRQREGVQREKYRGRRGRERDMRPRQREGKGKGRGTESERLARLSPLGEAEEEFADAAGLGPLESLRWPSSRGSAGQVKPTPERMPPGRWPANSHPAPQRSQRHPHPRKTWLQ
ncbi:unnamed protein product [Boreogadus saida]